MLKQRQSGGVFLRQQRDRDLVGHDLSTGLEDLEKASVHLQRASEDLEEGPGKDRVLETHKEMSQAATHPLGHTLRLLGARFNDVGHKRMNHLASSTADRTLSHYILYIRQTAIGFDSMLNSSIESAVTASSARRLSEKATSAPAETATTETEVLAISSGRALKVEEAEAIPEVPVLIGAAGGKTELVGCRRGRRLCQREDTS